MVKKMIIYLKPISTFPELHSDTIFGALTYAINKLYPEITNKMISSFIENKPPFILSSAFPFIFNDKEDFETGNKTKFFPKIILANINNKEHDYKILKEYKKVNYLDEKIFFNLILGKINEDKIISNFNNYTKFKDMLMNKKENIKFTYSEITTPNNSVNRLYNKTDGIFYTSGKKFKNMGLFFLIKFYDGTYKEIIRGAIKFLKDRGFGKDISTGKGQFDYYIDEDYSLESEYNLNNNLNNFITLSRFIPNTNDLNAINEYVKRDIKHINNYLSYEIDSKRSRDSSNEIRKEVKFFKEGSKFPYYGENFGRLVESGRINPAIEYGFAYPIKCVNITGDK